MIVGVQDVYYEVVDMKRALGFYRDVLGLHVTEESEHWSAFNVGGVRVGLDTTEGKPTPKRAILTLKTTDLRADVKRLREKGVKFIGEIGDYPWGSLVVFEDSEGNVLKLMQPPK
jgi:predicted enzyme related to lactoylglutathione lyase